MNTGSLLIQIDWSYFLGIIGFLICIAWYSNGRLTAIETSITWIKESLNKLDDRMTKLEGRFDKTFASDSPVKLLSRGVEVLEKSGLKEYIDKNKNDLIKKCEFKKNLTTSMISRKVLLSVLIHLILEISKIS